MPIERGRPERNKLQRSRIIGPRLHGVMAVVIVGESVKSKPNLLQMARALRLPRTHFAFGNDRQQQRSQDRNDGDDHQQLDQRERARGTMPEYFHGISSFTPFCAKAQPLRLYYVSGL